MPALIPVAAGFAASTAAVGAGIVAAGSLGATLISAGVGLAVSAAQGKRAQRKLNAAAEAARISTLTDRKSVIRSPVVPRNIVMGRDRVSGPLVCWFTYGPSREYHIFAVVLAGHECDAVEQYWFNGEPVTLDGLGNVTTEKYVRRRIIAVNETVTFDGSGVGTISHTTVNGVAKVRLPPENSGEGGTFALWENLTVSGTTVSNIFAASQSLLVSYSYEEVTYLFQIYTYLGAPGQQRSPYLQDAAAAAGLTWGDDRRGTNICYCVVRMRADFDVLGQIGVPNVSAVVRGAKPYDPRTGLTVWSQNPASLARWFLLQSGYAPALVAAEIGNDELIASANVCDEVITLRAGVSESRYRANGSLTSAASPYENLRHILDAMDGDATWVNGSWQIVAGRYRAPTLTLGESDFSEQEFRIAPYLPKDKLFNTITGTIVDASRNYVRTTYPAVRVATYVTQDNGETLPVTMDYALVNDVYRVQMIGWQRLTRARQQLTVEFGTNLAGYDTWPTENVLLDVPQIFGPSPKEISIQRRTLTPEGRLSFVGQETGAAVWNWNYADAQAAVDLPNTSLPDVVTVPTPVLARDPESGDAQLHINQDGTIESRIRIDLVPTTNTYVLNGGKIDTRIADADTLQWQPGPAAEGDETGFWFTSVEDGRTYSMQFRYRNNLGRVGSWSPLVQHRVIGKLEPPPDVTSFNVAGDVLSWAPVDAKDLAGYVFRFHYGSNSNWNTAAPLLGSPLADGRFDGVVTESPYRLSARPSGVVTLMVKAIDTSGNVSLNPSIIITNLGDAPIANIVEVVDFEAMDWPGVITGGAIVGSNVEADDTDLFYGSPGDAFYGSNLDLFYPASTYSELTYTTNPVVITDALVGSILTLDATIPTGTGLTIEYRLVDPAPFYGAADDTFYGSTAATFYGPSSGGDWLPWPGQVAASNDVYQFRVTLASGGEQGVIDALSLVIDAPDKVLQIEDLAVSSAGTALPIPTGYFTAIKVVQGTVQSNGSGGISTLVDKTVNLAPVVRIVDAAGTPVNGATADFTITGY